MAFFDYSPELVEAGKKAMELCAPQFAEFDRMAEYNGERVLKAFIDNRISDIHMKGTNGYGYGDDGRDKLDAVFAQILGAEDALVRHNFVNGTHAITTALFGILRPGDELLSVTGDPYDTMQGVISGDGIGSLKDFGVKFGKVDLLPDGTPDYDGIKSRAGTCRMAYIQRSRGYSLRPSLSIEVIAKICEAVRSVNPDCVIFTDNCYGELVEEKEPVSVGADLIAGSLIKNLGGGIAETGGYIAGRADLVELCAFRLTTPGHWQGGRRESESAPRNVPWNIPCAGSGMRGAQDCGVCGGSGGASRLRGVPEVQREAHRHHRGAEARRREAAHRVLPGHSGGLPGGQLRFPGAVGHAWLRQPGHHGGWSLHDGRFHRAFSGRSAA